LTGAWWLGSIVNAAVPLISWLRAADECSGAVLRTAVFPPSHFNQVPVGHVQAELRGLFGRRGVPGAVRVDNGSPWGSWSDLPPPLALWRIGLGLEVIWNPPRQPQRNGVIESSQGVGQRWVEPGQCASVAQLQARLDEEDRVQRELYPHRHGPPQLAVYPGLRHSGRRYSAAWERRQWSCPHAARRATESRFRPGSS
jgi:hypothetical protein